MNIIFKYLESYDRINAIIFIDMQQHMVPFDGDDFILK